MRWLLAFLCWVLAVVAGFAAVGLTWTAHHVRSESGYVALTSEMAGDDELRSNISAIIAARLVSSTGIEGGTADFVARAVEEYLNNSWTREEWREAWELSQASSHEINFDENRLNSQIVLDVAPMAKIVADDLTGDLPVTLRVPASVPINTGVNLPRPAVTFVDRSAELSVIAIALTAVFAFLTLVVAHRRAVALLWLGVGALLVVAAWWIAVTVGLPRIVDERVATSGELANTVDHFSVLLSESLRRSLTWVGVGGGAAIVLGLIGRTLGSTHDVDAESA